MSDVLSVYKKKENKTNEEILMDLVLETYCGLLKELREKCKGKFVTYLRQNIPSTKDIHCKLQWDFDAKAYDIIYGLELPSEADIANILNSKGCVFRWAGIVCNDAQLVMFDTLYESGIEI